MIVGAAAAAEIRCFQVSYAEKSRDKKTFWSWIGTMANGVIVAVVTWSLNRGKDD